MQNPRTAGIASFLRRYYAEQKRVSAGGFAKAAKKVLTAKEAAEVFEYMTSIKQCLVLSSEKRMYTWTCRQDHFNDTAVDEMLAFFHFRNKKDERHKKAEALNDPIPIKNTPNLFGASIDDLVHALERHGFEVTLRHIIK